MSVPPLSPAARVPGALRLRRPGPRRGLLQGRRRHRQRAAHRRGLDVRHRAAHRQGRHAARQLRGVLQLGDGGQI